MEAGGGAGAVEPQLMGAGGGAAAVEPQLMGAGGGAVAVKHQRAPHSMGAGIGAGAEETQQQRELPQHELEPSVVTKGVAAATSAMDR